MGKAVFGQILYHFFIAERRKCLPFGGNMVYNNSVYIINMMSRQEQPLPKEEQEVNNDAETSG
ncbi:MAG: hypothetical protein IJO10_04190 [Clostridia bacterium]|nr:hypothetical protein [Clostridia bacterium]